MSATYANDTFLSIPKRAIILSLLLHLLAPLIFLSTQIWPGLSLPFLPPRKDIKIEAKESFIQVDVVALPDQLPGEQAPVDMSLPVIEKPASAPERAAEEPEMALPKEKDAKEPLRKQKELEKKAKAEKLLKEKKLQEEQDKVLKKLQAEAARENALKSIAKSMELRGRQKLSGNILSKGNARSGAIGTSKDQYTALVMQAIKDRFNIYPWQKAKKLVSVIHIDVYPNGRVRSKRIVKRSTDPSFDSAVLQAIERSQPLPIPGDMDVLQGGITIEFRPE